MAGGAVSNPSDSEYAFSNWKLLFSPRAGSAGASAAAATYIYSLSNGGFSALAAAGTGLGAFYLDPADYGAGTRTTQLRLRALTQTNAVAPGAVNFTYGLYPIATYGGASNTIPNIATVGTATCSVTRASPSASSQYKDDTSAVTFPAAGWFCLALVTDATTAANSLEAITLMLQYRQV